MKKPVFYLAVFFIGSLLALAPGHAMAAEVRDPCVYDKSGNCSSVKPSPNKTGVTDIIKDAATILITAAGLLAVIMIIVSAIRMATSAGNPETVKSAKNTLMWSVIGLTLALLAIVIINLVIYIATEVA